MTKKELKELPYDPVTEDGERITVRVIDNVLVADCYIDRKPVGRYRMTKSGYHECLRIRKANGYGVMEEVEDPEWRTGSLLHIFGRVYWYVGGEIGAGKKDSQVLKEFLDEKYYKGARAIYEKEHDYRQERQKRAQNRKVQKIENRMNMVPAMGEGFYRWLSEDLFGMEYLFPAGDVYRCTACGGIHQKKGGYKDKQKVTCSRTGKTVQVEKRRDKIQEKTRVTVIQKMSEVESVIRNFKAEKVWTPKGSEVEAYEEIRTIVGRGWMKEMPVEIYYGTILDADEFGQEWWDKNERSKQFAKSYLYPYGIEEALEGTIYQNVPYEQMAEERYQMPWHKLMIHDAGLKYMEYFVKSGLRRLSEDLGKEMNVWYGTPGWVKEGNTMEEVLRIDKQKFQRLKEANGGKIYLDWLRWEQETGKHIKKEVLVWLEKKQVTVSDIDWILGRMSPKQVRNYVERERGSRTIRQTLMYWKDYLEMASAEGMNVMDQIIYRTKDMKQRHDELVEKRNREKDNKWILELKERFGDLGKICDGLRELYDYQDQNYLIRLPKDVKDVVREGHLLHHCVGSSDQYFEKMKKGESYILFLRRAEEPDTPWYTIEAKPDGTILQAYTEYDRKDGWEKAVKVLDRWKAQVKRKLFKEAV